MPEGWDEKQYPRLRATRLHAMLRERGYPGTAVQVRRYVRLMRPPSHQGMSQEHRGPPVDTITGTGYIGRRDGPHDPR
jgi:hypothetical protein